MVNSKLCDKKQSTGFPKLMVCEQSFGKLVVLFEKLEVGIVVHTPEDGVHSFGCFRDDWHMASFEDFHGTVTLSNGVDDE